MGRGGNVGPAQVGLVLPRFGLDELLHPGTVSAGRASEDPEGRLAAGLLDVNPAGSHFDDVGLDVGAQHVVVVRFGEGCDHPHRPVDHLDEVGEGITEQAGDARGDVDTGTPQLAGLDDLQPADEPGGLPDRAHPHEVQNLGDVGPSTAHIRGTPDHHPDGAWPRLVGVGIGIPSEELVGQFDPLTPSRRGGHRLGIQGEEVSAGGQDVGVATAGRSRRPRGHEPAVEGRHDGVDLVVGGVQPGHEVCEDPGEGFDDVPTFGTELLMTQLGRQIVRFGVVGVPVAVADDNRGEQLHAATMSLGHKLASGQTVGQVGGDGHWLAGSSRDLVKAGPPGIQHGFA